MSEPPDDVEPPSPGRVQQGSPRRILYPVLQSESDTTLHIAAGIAKATGAELFVGHVNVSTNDDAHDTSQDVAGTVFKLKTDISVEVDIQGQSLPGPSPLEAITTAASTYDISTIIIGDTTSERLEAQLSAKTGCDTVVVNARNRPDSVASILVPVAGGPHSGAAVEAAGALAEANGAWLELVHILEDESTEGREAADSLLEAGRSCLPDTVEVDTRVIEADDVVDEIKDESNYHDVTVIGAPQKGRLRRLVFGSTATDIRKEAQNTVVMVRHGSGPALTLFSDALSA